MSKAANQDAIRASFTQQAANFESKNMHFSQPEYLERMVSLLHPSKTDEVLEAAAGTCACARALAPHVGHVTCLDMTSAMLSVGQAEAAKEGKRNLTFLLGDVTELPFLPDSFDLVLSRLAFHHFPDPARPFAEMVRVLRPGGRLVLIDMEAPDERDTRDEIERLRDPSHVRNLTRAEMQALFAAHHLTIEQCGTTSMVMKLEAWMEYTHTPAPVREVIRQRMQAELSGGAKTGFAPYVRDGEICFNQQWVMLVGRKA